MEVTPKKGLFYIIQQAGCNSSKPEYADSRPMMTICNKSHAPGASQRKAMLTSEVPLPSASCRHPAGLHCQVASICVPWKGCIEIASYLSASVK